MKYYQIIGKNGVYLFTEKELKKALDRENTGVSGKILKEKALFGCIECSRLLPDSEVGCYCYKCNEK